jgi:hypothetical protein
VSNPRFCADCRPEAGPEGCSRPGAGVTNRHRNGERSARGFATALFFAYSSQIAHGMHCTLDADFCFCTRLRRPSHDQRRAVLDVVKALAALDPAGFGLDDACAQLERSTYVLAEEARRIVWY